MNRLINLTKLILYPFWIVAFIHDLQTDPNNSKKRIRGPLWFVGSTLFLILFYGLLYFAKVDPLFFPQMPFSDSLVYSSIFCWLIFFFAGAGQYPYTQWLFKRWNNLRNGWTFLTYLYLLPLMIGITGVSQLVHWIYSYEKSFLFTLFFYWGLAALFMGCLKTLYARYLWEKILYSLGSQQMFIFLTLFLIPMSSPVLQENLIQTILFTFSLNLLTIGYWFYLPGAMDQTSKGLFVFELSSKNLVSDIRKGTSYPLWIIASLGLCFMAYLIYQLTIHFSYMSFVGGLPWVAAMVLMIVLQLDGLQTQLLPFAKTTQRMGVH